MSNNTKLVKIFLICLSFTLIVLTGGFVVLTMKLNDVKNNVESFDVSFTDIQKVSSIKGGEKDPNGKLEITSYGKMVDMDFDLFMEHDEMQYDIKIVNNGTISASIVNLFMSSDGLDDKDVSISLSDLSGKIIDPGEEITARLSIYYKGDTTNSDVQKRVIDKKVTGKIGLLVDSNTNS